MKQRRWQFSIRSLLVLTAVTSLVLAVAVRLPMFFRVALLISVPVLLVVAVLQSANFATSDRRPRFALLSWTSFAAFFVLFALAIVRAGLSYASLVALCLMLACSIACVVQARRSYLLIGRSPIAIDSMQSRTAVTPTEPAQDKK